MRRNPLTYLNVVLLALAFLIMVWIKPGSINYFSPVYIIGFGVLAVIWFTVTLVFKKYNPKRPPSGSISLHIIIINLLIFGIIAIAMYGAGSIDYSRLIVFGTIGFTTLFEIIFNKTHRLIIHNGNGNGNGTATVKKKKPLLPEAAKKQAVHDIKIRDISLSASQLKKDIVEECGEKAYQFIDENIDLLDSRNLVISTTTRFNLLYQPDNYLTGIINLKRVNDIRYLNKFFETINGKLPVGGKYIGCAETKNQRKRRILKKYPPVFKWIYYFFDYIIKRIFPKFNMTKKLYFLLTRGENRVLTQAEILGRLYSCGYEVEKEGFANGNYFWMVTKVKEPLYDMNPTYGALIRLPRIGKDGKIIRVYKMRTMHPYAEYLQEYVYNKSSLKAGGKFNNDFRISSAGRIMRALWIDELPMLINWLRGDLKFVGVRPLSEHYFNLYSKEHQERRKQYKPGLVPPYYADLPKSLDEIEASEKKYLDAYDKKHFRTNWRYFWRVFYNIVFKKARSR